MKLSAMFRNPNAVLISRTPASDPATDAEFVTAAQQAMRALEVELEDETVVLHPNSTVGELHDGWDHGITTHPQFVKGLVQYLHAHGAERARVYIVEDPRNNNTDDVRHWRNTGYLPVAEETGAILHSHASFQTTRREVPNWFVHPFRNVAALAVAPNTVLLNVPKLKTHYLAITTLSIKNLMGLDNGYDRHYCGQAWVQMGPGYSDNPRPRTDWLSAADHERWQELLAQRLIDQARAVTPHLNVIDGVVGREGTGFNQGTNFSLGLAIAGVNMAAVDTVGSYLMGFDPAKLVYLRMAAQANLGPTDLNNIQVYLAEGGRVAPCHDLAALRAPKPFSIIRGIPCESDDYAR